jgi:hypothetical protein
MVAMTEIQIIYPQACNIPIPQHVFDEFVRLVNRKQLADVITEALTEELKKLRFRQDLKNARSKAV